MATVTGQVGWCGKNKFGKYSIKLEDNDTWYSSQFPIEAEKGDIVEFDDGGKKYCNRLKVVNGGTSTSAGTASSGKAAPSNKDRSIIRQNSLAHAVNLYGTATLTIEDSDGDVDLVATKVIELARKFEAYSSGDLDNPAKPAIAAQSDGDFLDG